MKGYRKLAPGEVIREGDVHLPEGVQAKSMIGLAAGTGSVWMRRARTDGCPEGWRWADEGEQYNNFAHQGTKEIEAAARVFKSAIDAKDYGPVMPYPENSK